MTEKESEAFDLGFAHAFDWCSERKEHPGNPYPKGSPEHAKYEDGYESGIDLYEHS